MAIWLPKITLCLFALMMAAAAVEDFRRLIIPNGLTAGMALLWLPYGIATVAPVVLAETVGCAAIVLLLGIVLFGLGHLGGGDVKLLTVATLWAGPGATLELFLVTGVFGGVLALALLTPFGTVVTALQHIYGAIGAPPPSRTRTPIPYGVAIAAAAIAVIVLPHFN